MPTSSDLLDLICDDLGLDASTSSDDRTAALRALNRANRQICQLVLRDHKTVDYVVPVATTDIALTAVPTLSGDFSALDHLRVIDASGNISAPLTRKLREPLLTDRTTTQGSPGVYAYAWPYVMLDRPADGTFSLRFHYVGLPDVLVDDSNSPTSISPGWQESVLAGLAKVIILEGREGRETDAVYHRGVFQQSFADFKSSQSREGGLNLPEDIAGTRAFDTKPPLRLR